MLFNNTKGSIYRIKHYVHIIIYLWSGLPETERLMEVSIKFDIGTYCVFTSDGCM